MRRIAIRADASRAIGTGHVMRCRTLANALRQRGAAVSFFFRELPEHLEAALRTDGHTVVRLRAAASSIGSAPGDLAHSHWLAVSSAEDAEEVNAALPGAEWDWMIVDHYGLDARWERSVRRRARRIMAIDDLADRLHDCDVLLDQNLYPGMEGRYDGWTLARTERLLGPRYALLRPEFAAARATMRTRDGSVRNILVFFGGIDAENHTSIALAALERARLAASVDVVIGASHPSKDAIQAACAARGHVCHVESNRMAELMRGADLAVGGSGSASWERCCLGLPTVGVAIAENQRAIAAALAEAGAVMLVAGDSAELADALARQLQQLAHEPARLRAMAASASALVDGAGAERVAERLLAFP